MYDLSNLMRKIFIYIANLFLDKKRMGKTLMFLTLTKYFFHKSDKREIIYYRLQN